MEQILHNLVIGFGVASREEVDRLCADLAAAGHRIQQRPYDAFWGARYAWDTEAQLPNLRLLRAPLDEALARLDPDFFFVSPQTNPAALLVDARRSRARRMPITLSCNSMPASATRKARLRRSPLCRKRTASGAPPDIT